MKKWEIFARKVAIYRLILLREMHIIKKNEVNHRDRVLGDLHYGER